MELGFPLERALWNTGSERTASVRWAPPLRQASGRQELGASGSIGKGLLGGWQDFDLLRSRSVLGTSVGVRAGYNCDWVFVG